MKSLDTRVAKALVGAAERIPGVSTGLACTGTTLESRTFATASKAFLFVGVKDARLKLRASLPEAEALARQIPDSVRVGSGGWTTITLHAAEGLTLPVLGRWVAESHNLMAGSARALKPKTPLRRSRKSAKAGPSS
jgi:hypothetical protein